MFQSEWLIRLSCYFKNHADKIDDRKLRPENCVKTGLAILTNTQ